MANAPDVAAYLLRECPGLDALKLEKLLYYAQAWHLVWRDGVPLYNDRIEAWVHGPVVPSVYAMHRGRHDVDPSRIGGNPDAIGRSSAAVLDFVCGHYGQLSSRELVDLTHAERPWRVTRERAHAAAGQHCSAQIPLDVIREYYVEDRELNDQAWFWSPEWYDGELESEAEAGFDDAGADSRMSGDAFLASLD